MECDASATTVRCIAKNWRKSIETVTSTVPRARPVDLVRGCRARALTNESAPSGCSMIQYEQEFFYYHRKRWSGWQAMYKKISHKPCMP